MESNIIKASELNNLILDSSFYYFLLPYGIGDAVMIFSFVKAIKEKINSNIIFIIQKNHEIIAKMFKIENYILYENDSYYNKNQRILRQLNNIANIPKQGKIYICHPEFDSVGNSRRTERLFREWYKQFLDIPSDSKMDIKSIQYPIISTSLKAKIFEEFGVNVEDIVFFLPEANSISCFPNNFWLKLYQKLRNEGNIVITNKNKCNLSFLPSVDITLADQIALCLACKHVYAIRSGICDAIFSKGKDLTVFYNSQSVIDEYSLNANFGNYSVNEIIV